jgi:hypothetical protein
MKNYNRTVSRPVSTWTWHYWNGPTLERAQSRALYENACRLPAYGTRDQAIAALARLTQADETDSPLPYVLLESFTVDVTYA